MVSVRSTPWQRAVRWLLTALTCLLFLAYGLWPEPPEPAAEDDSKRIQIEGMRPLELAPGGALTIRFSSSDPDGPPVTVSIDKQPAEILRRRPGIVVARVPQDLEEGRAKVRVHQGEERSKKRDVWLRPLSMSKVVQTSLLGVALLVLGLRTLARGIRTYAGNRLRRGFDRLSAGGWRSMLVGVLLGGATQSTTASAGVLVGLLSSRLVSRSTALVAILGAQLGAATVALLLPLGTRAAVLLVALGVIWVSLADNRHARALAKVLLGLGLLLFGFETVRAGFQPLVASAEYLHSLTSGSSILDSAGAALLGALMTALLQGPGPPFVLVLGLVESTETANMHEGLSILAGVPLGVALASAVVAWPFGGRPRKWARTHLLLGLLGTLALTWTAPLWTTITDPMVPGDPELVGAQQVLLPAVAPHLAASFLLSQSVVVLLLVATLPRLRRWFEPTESAVTAPGHEQTTAAPEQQLHAGLIRLRSALGHVHGIWRQGERANARGAEEALSVAGQELSQLLESLRGTDTSGALFSATMALLKARDDLVSLQRLTERGLEQGLSPAEAESEMLDRLHDLVSQGLLALTQSLDSPAAGDWESAREREIWLNAEDARARTRLQDRRTALELDYLQHWSAVSAAYEQLGNQLFRAADALWGDAD